MQRLKTFIHQKRYFEETGQSVKRSIKPKRKKNIADDDWNGTIDHRKVEAHRLRWQKNIDRIIYFIAAGFVLYALFQWFSG